MGDLLPLNFCSFLQTILTLSTGPMPIMAQGQLNFVWTIKFFSFYLDTCICIEYIQEFDQTSKFKFSLGGLQGVFSLHVIGLNGCLSKRMKYFTYLYYYTTCESTCMMIYS